MQGCNLRCRCCHNPDTHSASGGKEYTADELVKMATRYREYFGDEGGITVSGGEPILQAEFVTELFRLCHQNEINTCLDTSGSVLNEAVKKLLAECDRVLLDYKYTTDELYRENVGCPKASVDEFLDYLNEKAIPTTLRQVIIPTVNDSVQNIRALKAVADAHPCVDKVELLPFKKICQVKYDQMGIPFPFAHIPEPSGEQMAELRNLMDE
jgi:pyruvate formate lyase activating enzyme